MSKLMELTSTCTRSRRRWWTSGVVPGAQTARTSVAAAAAEKFLKPRNLGETTDLDLAEKADSRCPPHAHRSSRAGSAVLSSTVASRAGLSDRRHP